MVARGNEINSRHPESGNTPLGQAVTYGHLDIAKYLIEKGARVSGSNRDGNTPLQLACRNGHLAVCQLLIQRAGAAGDMPRRNRAGKCPAQDSAHDGVVGWLQQQETEKKSPAALKDCAHCGASEGSVPGIVVHRACARCSMTFYCSKSCQKAHWSGPTGHRHYCVSPTKRSAAEALRQRPSSPAATAADTCSVCFEAVTEEACSPPCGHAIHASCRVTLRHCPVCRGVF